MEIQESRELQELRRNIGKKVYNICKNIAITRKKTN